MIETKTEALRDYMIDLQTKEKNKLAKFSNRFLRLFMNSSKTAGKNSQDLRK